MVRKIKQKLFLFKNRVKFSFLSSLENSGQRYEVVSKVSFCRKKFFVNYRVIMLKYLFIYLLITTQLQNIFSFYELSNLHLILGVV